MNKKARRMTKQLSQGKPTTGNSAIVDLLKSIFGRKK